MQASRKAEKKCTEQGEARRINYKAWVQYESLTFCGMYLKDVETTFNRPQRNNDGGMRKEKLSVAHWFVLNNCDEIMAYLDEHEEIMKREHPSHLVAQKHRE
ncbi:hypothetical protein Prudu_021688 [Prunus dulcis]|uniref:DUF4218 domain-containing protein n=1 Tax=Prunus dulcis TaxID=3755 RepID=A0A4Y1RXX7_PRUDU|nr:hypothetical protein Prudu_021688 [Prunus dulcis]